MKQLLSLLALVTLATPLAAQRSQAIEFGGFGSYWRFDRSFQLENGFGGGARIGYNVSDRVALEVVGDYVATHDIANTTDVRVSTIGANLVLNFQMGDRATLYASGGYARMVFAPQQANPSYDFTQHLLAGGLGARFFVSDHVALRLEGRAQYRPDNPLYPDAFTGQVQGSAGASYFFIPPQQGRGWNKDYQWYWGAQGGALISKTNTEPLVYNPVVGGHWLITARRTALYVAYEQSFFLNDAHAVIFDQGSSGCSLGSVPCRDVTFNDVRRIMFGVLAFPAQKVIEPFAGGGFALMQVLNPEVDCSSCTTLGEVVQAEDLAHDASSKAFFWIMGGLQINYSSKLNVFAHYMLTSSASGFLIDGNTHTLQGGIRYSLGSAKEGITERH